MPRSMEILAGKCTPTFFNDKTYNKNMIFSKV